MGSLCSCIADALAIGDAEPTCSLYSDDRKEGNHAAGIAPAALRSPLVCWKTATMFRPP